MTSTRWLVLVLLLVSLVLLIPGLFAPVLTIRWVLTHDGIAQVAPTMLQKGLNDDTLNALKAMMNPTVVALLDATGGDLRQMIVDKVTRTAAKAKPGPMAGKARRIAANRMGVAKPIVAKATVASVA